MKLNDILTEVVVPQAPKKPITHTQQMIKNAIPGKTDVVSARRDKLERLVTSNKRMKPVADEVSKDPDHEFVGAGLNAYVHRTNNPHSLDRVHRTSAENEGTNIYLEFIRTHPRLHNNPWFPKVKGSQRRSNGAVTIDIERLVPFDTPGLGDNVELLTSVWERYIPTRAIPERPDDMIDEDFARRLAWRLLDHIEFSIKTGRGSDDPSLRQVHTIITHIRDTHDMLVDIHAENVMWRLTSVGPQLVITDPLWAGWGSLEASS